MDYIWDLDGTLLDSYGVIVASLVKVAAGVGVPDTAEEILRKVKQGSVSGYLRELSRKAEADYDVLYQAYRQASHSRETGISLMPGAVSTLRELQEHGARHFVFTHRGASTGRLLDQLGLTTFFQEVVTWEAGFPPKPSGAGVRYLVEKYHLNPEHTAYVGDRALDVGCATDAGVRAVLLRPMDSCVAPTGDEDLVIDQLNAALFEPLSKAESF